jgi:hypothetical protein
VAEAIFEGVAARSLALESQVSAFMHDSGDRRIGEVTSVATLGLLLGVARSLPLGLEAAAGPGEAILISSSCRRRSRAWPIAFCRASRWPEPTGRGGAIERMTALAFLEYAQKPAEPGFRQAVGWVLRDEPYIFRYFNQHNAVKLFIQPTKKLKKIFLFSL